MKIIETKNAPAAVGSYSQAIVAGSLVFTSGMLPIVPETGALVQGAIEEQTEQAIKNIAAVLEAAGSEITKAVKTTCYLKNMGDFAAFNAVYAKYFTGKPARSCSEASALPKGALLEIDVIAEL
ncbi:MAG: RidA family protein [Clostridia bacterium]|nr:RidA family protein [Clostridia bacterium]